MNPGYIQAREQLLDLVKRTTVLTKIQNVETRLRNLVQTLQGNETSTQRNARKDRQTVAERCSNFAPETTEAYKFFTDKGIAPDRIHDLKTLGEILSKLSGISMDRESKRRSICFWKWLHENWETLRPIAETKIGIEFED